MWPILFADLKHCSNSRILWDSILRLCLRPRRPQLPWFSFMLRTYLQARRVEWCAHRRRRGSLFDSLNNCLCVLAGGYGRCTCTTNCRRRTPNWRCLWNLVVWLTLLGPRREWAKHRFKCIDSTSLSHSQTMLWIATNGSFIALILFILVGDHRKGLPASMSPYLCCRYHLACVGYYCHDARGGLLGYFVH